MKAPEYYRDREQTYLKHYFLERYLERVAYIIGYSNDEFVYVDGFSGPWKSEDEQFEDTSFMIALQKLRNVRENLGKAGKYPRIRCLFIEKDPEAYSELEQATKNYPRAEVEVLNGEFEVLIPDILRFIGPSFSLVFIDPTGWTGFGLQQIAPILKHHRGEVIVNFMFDYINRFLEHTTPAITRQMNELFGGPGWEKVVQSSPRREEAIVSLYRERMREVGGYRFVTSTRILKPTADRAYFYLIYGTRHLKGLCEFSNVEKKFASEQEHVRSNAIQRSRIERSGQNELFPASESTDDTLDFNEERAAQLATAATRIMQVIRESKRIRYEDLLARILEMPLVWQSDINDELQQLYKNGVINIEGLKGRERVPKVGHGHMIVLISH
jgi:three-Cys-motif partner protein